jgi:hypothetical protein
MLTAVRNWVIRTMMKSKGQTGIVRTLPDKDLIELNTQITAQRLMQGGIDPTTLKNADQVENAIIAMESRPKVQQGIRSTKSAKVFDMEGKEIDPRSKIMGGKQAETEAEIAERLSKENKESVARIKNKKMVKDAIDNASPGFVSGDRKYNAQLVAEDLADKKFGKEFYDLDQRQQMDLYDEALEGLSEQTRGMPDPDDFAQGGRAGFFMGSANPKGLGTLRAILNYMSKKGKETGGFKGADLSGLDMLRLSNPKALNKMLEDVRGKVNIREGIMGTDTVRAQQQALREKRKGLTEKSLDVARAMKEEQDKIAKRIEREAEKTIIPKVKKQLMEGMGMSEEVAEKAARDMAEAAQNIKLMDSPPEITDEGLLQLENVLKNLETGGKKKRDLNADGGRIGFKDGMTRRTFLKIFGGLVSLPIVGKVLAPLKLTRGVSKVPIIKTDNVPGKPEWFDQLVNKVIIEGDDVTKKFATGERQSIHQKTLDDGSVVRVTEDVDDGAVRVEYESEANTFADTVQLQYKKPLPDEGDPRPAAEFTTSESGPVGRQYGPDDFEIEVDEVGGRSIGDLDSDVSKLKEYATGKKLTMKEIVEAKRRRDKALAISENIDEAQLNAVMLRQGDADDSYFGDPDDFASGGIARMLGE